MTMPEKLGIAGIMVFVAVVGYFLYDIVLAERPEDTSYVEESPPVKGEGETPVIEDRILDKTGASLEDTSSRQRIDPTPIEERIVGSAYGAVSGRVVDEDGKPIEGAEITLRKGGSSILPHLPAQEKLDIDEATDGQGRYEVGGIEGGDSYAIVASHPDYAEETFSPVKIKAGVRLEIPDIVMGHGTSVLGVVTDPFQNPIAGARVQIYDPVGQPFLEKEERTPWKQMLTDGQGAYRFDNVAFKTFEVVASADGYATQRKSNNVQFEAAKEKTVDFMLQLGSFIAGSVTDPKGIPLAEVQVDATMVQNKEYSSSGSVLTGKDGFFSIQGLAEGKYVVRASRPEYSDDVRQNIPSGMNDLKLVLQPRGGVAGFVLDYETNKPVANFTVRALLSRTGRPPKRTKISEQFNAKDGAYRITDLDPGVYRFVVNAKGYAECSSDEVTVVRDYIVDNVDIYMNRGGELSGRVVDPSGKPIANVKVTLNENNFQDNPLYQIFAAMAGPNVDPKKPSAFTRDDGTFKMAMIVPGTYQVAFSHGNYSEKAVNDVEVFLGEGNIMGDVVLKPGAKVHGTVYGTDGKAIPGVTVNINQPNAFMRQASADKEGRFVFSHLNPGEYTLSVQLHRLGGRNIDNIFTQLMISKKSEIKVYLEEGADVKADIHLIE